MDKEIVARLVVQNQGNPDLTDVLHKALCSGGVQQDSLTRAVNHARRAMVSK